MRSYPLADSLIVEVQIRPTLHPTPTLGHRYRPGKPPFNPQLSPWLAAPRAQVSSISRWKAH